MGAPVPQSRRELRLRLLLRFVYGWGSNVVALFLAAVIFPGIGYGSFWTLVVAALVFGLVNLVVRPVVVFLTLPAVIVTLGIGLVFVNALMLWLTDVIVPSFEVSGFWTAVGGAVIVWLANVLLAAALKPDFKTAGRWRRGP